MWRQQVFRPRMCGRAVCEWSCGVGAAPTPPLPYDPQNTPHTWGAAESLAAIVEIDPTNPAVGG